MAIYKLIANGSFGPDEIEAMSAAYESALVNLGIVNRELRYGISSLCPLHRAFSAFPKEISFDHQNTKREFGPPEIGLRVRLLLGGTTDR